MNPLTALAHSVRAILRLRRRQTPRQHSRRHQLALELLESREMLSGTPLANPASFSVLHDTPLAMDLVQYSDDADGDPLTYSIVQGPANGVLTPGTPNSASSMPGEFMYTPGAGFVGTDAFTYQVSDGVALSGIATVTVNVMDALPLAQPPVANDLSISVPENGRYNGWVTATGGGGWPLVFAQTTNTYDGILSFDASGYFSYVPEFNYVGTDSFDFVVSAGSMQSNVATVSITVTPVEPPDGGGDGSGGSDSGGGGNPNTPPVATDQSLSTFPNQTLIGAVTAADPDGDVLTYALISPPTQGTVNIANDGSFAYVPAQDYTGTDSFTFDANDGTGDSNIATIAITVSTANAPPIADDDSLNVVENTPASGSVSATDPNGQALTCALVDSPGNGTVTFNSDGTYVYTPDAGFTGADGFTFKANNGSADSNVADVSVTVAPPTSAITIVLPDQQAIAISGTALFSTSQGNAIRVADPAPVGDIQVSLSMTTGTLTLAGTGGLTFTQGSGAGDQAMTFSGSLADVNAALDGLVYAPPTGFGGEAVLTMNATDLGVPGGGASDSQDLAIAVGSVVAVNDSYAIEEGSGLSIATADQGVLANDLDLLGEPLTATLVTAPANGMVNLNSDGTFTYLPAMGYYGTDSFTYQAADASGGFANAVATIQIDAPPVVENPAYSVLHDTILNTLASGIGGLLTYVNNPSGTTIGIVDNTDPSHGTVVVYDDGNFIYTPDLNYAGPDSFSFTVSDGVASVTGIVNITVTDQAPTTSDLSFNGIRNQQLSVDPAGLLGGANDPDGDPLEIVAINGVPLSLDNTGGTGAGSGGMGLGGPGGGSPPPGDQLTVYADGAFDYMPAPGFVGDYQFTFTVSDGVLTATGTATIHVVEQAPVPQPESFFLEPGQALSVPVALGLLADEPGIGPSFDSVCAIDDVPYTTGSLFTLPSGSQLVVGADGSFTYWPEPGRVAGDDFSYTVSDGLASNSSSVTLPLDGPLPPPTAFKEGIYSTLLSTPLELSDLLLDDSYIDGQPVLLASFTQPAHGTLTRWDGYGSLEYEPEPGYLGPDSFDYVVNDLNGDSSAATVQLEVVRRVTWTGAGDGTNWSDPANWSDNLVPDPYTDVTIDSGTVTVADAGNADSMTCGGTLDVAGSLTLGPCDSTVSGTLNVSGSLTLEAVPDCSFSEGQLQEGTLTLSGGGSLGGSLYLGTNSTLALAPGAAIALDNVTIAGDGVLRNLGATLTVTGTDELENSAMYAGVLAGSGTYSIVTSFAWNGGDLNAGTVSVGADATMTIDAGSDKAVNGSVLQNGGQMNWNSDETIAVTAGEIDNQEDGAFEIYGDGTLQGAAPFNNRGILGSYGYDVVALGALNNMGDIDVQSGQLEIGGGVFNSSGTVTVGAGRLRVTTSGSGSGSFNVDDPAGTIEFAASYTLTAASAVSASGAISFTAGTTTIAGTFSAQTTSINRAAAVFTTDFSTANFLLGGPNARLGGTGTLTVTSQMDWSGGAMDGGGQTIIGADAVASLISVDAYDAKTLGTVNSTRDFTNNGQVLWYGGTLNLNDSTLHNWGTFKILGNNIVFRTVLDPGMFDNAGTVIKQLDDPVPADPVAPVPPFGPDIQNGGTTAIDVPLTNRAGATIDVEIGTLDLVRTTNNGTITIAPNARLAFRDTLALNQGSVVQGTGTLVVGGVTCTLAVNGIVTVPTVWLNGGTIQGPGTLIVTNMFTWSSGQMAGSGQTAVLGGGVVVVDDSGQKVFSRRLFSNYGAFESGSATQFIRNGVAGRRSEFYVETTRGAATLADTATTAVNRYVNAINDAQADTLFGAEQRANGLYNTRVNALNDDFVAAVNQGTLVGDAAAGLADDYPPESGPALDLAAEGEQIRDTRIAEAATTLTNREAIYYREYLNSMVSATTAYNSDLQTAQTQLQRSLRHAAYQGGLIGDISAWAVYMHDLLRGNVVAPSVPAGHAGPVNDPNPLDFLKGLSSNSRDALAIAYFRRWGIELVDDINATQWFWNRAAVVGALYGQSVNTWGVNIANMVDQVGAWSGSALASVAAHADNLVQAAGDFGPTGPWAAIGQTVNDSVQLLRNDPLQFVATAGQVWWNTATVQANTLTFGLIPALNESAQSLITQSNFYRGVQVVAVLGREAALTFFTGGAGNVVGAGIRGLSLAARYAGPIAGRLATRALLRYTGVTVTTAITRGAGIAGCVLTSGFRVAQPYFLYQQTAGIISNISQANAAIHRGDYETAAALLGRSAGTMPHAWASARESLRLLNALRSMNPQTITNYLAACFAAGTPIQGEHGPKAIEDYQAGERVWARNESNPDAPLELKEIEEVFVSEAPLWHVHVGGQVIRTTAEHPFWVVGKGWTAAQALTVGDALIARDGTPTRVEQVFETGTWETVYNFRVADDHTYFVGCPEWGFEVWAHNAPCVKARPGMQPRQVQGNGKTVPIYGTAQNTSGVRNNPVTGAIVDRHARTVDALATEQANDLIRRTDVVQGWVTMNRAVRTAVGPDSIAPGATGTVRPDVTVVYQTRDLRWHVRVFEVPSPGQGDAFVRQQRQLAQASLLPSIDWDQVPNNGIVDLLP